MSFKEFLNRIMGKKSKTTEKESLKLLGTEKAKTGPESNIDSNVGVKADAGNFDDLIYDEIMTVLAKHYKGRSESDVTKLFYARAPGQLFRIITAIFMAGKMEGYYGPGQLGWFKARVGEELDRVDKPLLSIVSNKDDPEGGTLH